MAFSAPSRSLVAVVVAAAFLGGDWVWCAIPFACLFACQVCVYVRQDSDLTQSGLNTKRQFASIEAEIRSWCAVISVYGCNDHFALNIWEHDGGDANVCKTQNTDQVKSVDTETLSKFLKRAPLRNTDCYSYYVGISSFNSIALYTYISVCVSRT